MERARATFNKYFGERCFGAEDGAPRSKKDGAERSIPFDMQARIPEMVMCVRAAPDTPGRRFIEWFSGIGDSLCLTAFTVVGSFAAGGFLGHLWQDDTAKFDPRHPSGWFIVGGLVGAYAGLKLLGCVHAALKGWVHNIEKRETASVACDVLLSGYVTVGWVREKLTEMIRDVLV